MSARAREASDLIAGQVIVKRAWLHLREMEVALHGIGAAAGLVDEAVGIDYYGAIPSAWMEDLPALQPMRIVRIGGK